MTSGRGGVHPEWNDLERYVLEEWIEEYRDGKLGRREFLRRAAIFCGGTAAALGVLDRAGVPVSAQELADAASAQAPAPPPLAAQSVPANDPAVRARMVTFPGENVTMHGYLAVPANVPRSPGVVVIHENRGLTEHFADLSRRFAKAGYAALAVDLVSHEGGTVSFTDSAQVGTALARTSPAVLVGMLNAAFRYLQAQPEVFPSRIGAIGFCFGGGLVWRLATSNPELKAAAPFYGSNPPLEDVPKIRAAVFAAYGELDARINAGIPAITEALRAHSVRHWIEVYSGAGHAFFNDTATAYHRPSAERAWTQVLAWFREHLA
jgi:carboxymethylenebutenolidase